MKIETLTLKNFRGFKDAEIHFSEGLAVLVGENGAGKSSVLDALGMLLSWAVARIRTENGKGRRMAETDIHNDAPSASIGLTVQSHGVAHSWTLAGTQPGKMNGIQSDWKGLAAFAARIRREITASDEKCSVPICPYYPARRTVTRVPVGAPKNRRIFRLLECYEPGHAAPADFRAFFEWFRAREDLENELRLRVARRTNNTKIRPEAADEQLKVVRHALQEILPGLTDFTVYRDEPALIAKKRGRHIRVDQLSDGEKLLAALGGDIARRLAIANPTLGNPLHGEGVVLIDEIEQHLHPAWQRTVIGSLRRAFPNIQFIVSTHSPQVLGEVAHEHIRLLNVDKDGTITITSPSQSLGLDTNLVLEEIMNAPARNQAVSRRLRDILNDIDKENEDSLARARHEIEQLKNDLDGYIPDLVEAEAMLFMLENR